MRWFRCPDCGERCPAALLGEGGTRRDLPYAYRREGAIGTAPELVVGGDGPDEFRERVSMAPIKERKAVAESLCAPCAPGKLNPICVLQGFGCFLGAGNGFQYRLALSFECVEQLRELF